MAQVHLVPTVNVKPNVLERRTRSGGGLVTSPGSNSLTLAALAPQRSYRAIVSPPASAIKVVGLLVIIKS